MSLTPKGINTFIFFNLPSAWWTGVRVVKITSSYCEVKVRLKWINKNPLKYPLNIKKQFFWETSKISSFDDLFQEEFIEIDSFFN